MPDDDWALAKRTVDFRNEERMARHGRTLKPPTRSPRENGIDLNGDILPLALCTQDTQCQAEADQHQTNCPVEQQLRDELGF